MSKLDDDSLMETALGEARIAAELQEVPVGAVLVLDDLIIKGHNCVITNSDPTAHAEVVVIREAAKLVNNYRLTKARLYVTLEPCLMCVGAIIQARIARVVYGAQDLRYGAIESMMKAFDLSVNHKPQLLGGVRAEESADLLTKFFKARRSGEVPKWS